MSFCDKTGAITKNDLEFVFAPEPNLLMTDSATDHHQVDTPTCQSHQILLQPYNPGR